MDQKGKDLLNLMFNPGEEVALSPDRFGFHSVSLDRAMGDRVTLMSTEFRDGKPIQECQRTYNSEDIQLVALNPIKGWRNDASCTAFRSFLVECDDMPLSQQLAYVKSMGLPYSAIVYSGGKSLHVLVTLSQDLPNEKTWRHVAEWILNAMPKADPNTKNPSRSIRIPGARRGDKRQKLVEIHGRIPHKTLYDWLKLHPKCEPKIVQPKPKNNLKSFPRMKPWMVKSLKDGEFPNGRNQTWFAIAVEFFMNGYDQDSVIEVLEDYFTEDRDFKRKEWLTSIKSAGKYVEERK